MVDDLGVEVQELGLAGTSTVGGLIPFEGASPERQAAWVGAAFEEHLEQAPVVREVAVVPTDETVPLEVRSALAMAPEAAAEGDTQHAWTPPRDAQPRPAQAQDVPEHFPSIWQGSTYRYHDTDGTTFHTYEYLFEYESDYAANPDLYPSDWGMELGITSRNSSLSGIRPACFGGDATTDFWSSTYGAGGVWGTNVPEAARPYADYQIASDSCEDNSVEIGIGFPNELAQDATYGAFVRLMPGTESLSLAWAEASMISNDCNDLGQDPHTNCMGLNTDRDPPQGYEELQSYVNINRDWYVPGCALMADGLTDPVFYESGTSNCPSDVYPA